MLPLTKTVLAAIGSWLSALVLLFAFPLFPAFSGFALIWSVPIAAILLILTLIALIKERRKAWALVCAALLLAAFFSVLPRAMYLGAMVHLFLHRQTYETTAQRMLAARDKAEERRICGEQCWVMSSKGGQVAFHYVHGFLNWNDIIYDPSGKVAIKPLDARDKIDMYFISAEHLTGDWYLGHFGD